MNPFDIATNMLCGAPDLNRVHHIRDSVARFTENLARAGSRMVDVVRDTAYRFISDEAIERAYDVYHNFRNPLRHDRITFDREDPTNLNYFTKSVILSNPYIREMYDDGEVYGFNPESRWVEEDIDSKESVIYQNIMDGVATSRGEDEAFLFTDSSDFRFNVDEKEEILEMWDYYLLNLPEDDLTIERGE